MSISHDVKPTRTAVISPYQTQRRSQDEQQSRLEEAVSLAGAIALDVVHKQSLPLRAIRPSHYLGGGQTEAIATQVTEQKLELVIVDASLTPVQQRNLERAWKTKVIDRTGLILEIFGERAQTKEGMLQVELAALTYQRSRLVRSWTHLERQRGGLGFIGGPGESQLEIDRRLINNRIKRIKRDLNKVTKGRTLQRQKRRKQAVPVVALVGYTNAGKSTLFNRLTKAKVLAADQLFATLDPTMRRLRLPKGTQIILSDTVGFIADLPTELIAAFRATLEEVVNADLLLHVYDVASSHSRQHREDVNQTLAVLGIPETYDIPIVMVANKCDQLPDERLQARKKKPGRFDVSALNGEGVESLLRAMEALLQGCEGAAQTAI